MAELNIENIKLLEYNVTAKGFLEFDNEDLSFFEKETWKLFVTTIGGKILDQYKEKIFGECMIQFFPVGKENLEKQNSRTFMMKTLIKPLFFIKYDSSLYIEFIHKSGEKIPKQVFFLVLCR